MSSNYDEARRLLLHNLTVLKPRADELEAEMYRCIGIPWRFLRWRRALNAHRATVREMEANTSEANRLMAEVS